MSTPLRTSRSALNPRVTLITADRAPSPPPPVKAEPVSPKVRYTSLRRSTRSSIPAVSAPLPVRNDGALKRSLTLDRSKYEYAPPSTPSPRKKSRLDQAKSAPRGIKLELDLGGNDATDQASPTNSAHVKTPKSAKKPMPQLALEKPHPAPPRWEEQYKLIERMRKGIVAPVDDMGCERPRTIVDNDPKTVRFHVLISLMLSSQTKDPVTSQAVSNLHDTLPGGLTAQSLADASLETVQGCINKVGFWRRKADYIQDAAKLLLAKDGDEKGDVPKTLEGLCELKGVGPKMAFLALQCAWNINAGIGVDVHVHRITNRLKWHKPPTTTPEQTRLNLQSWLPPELHKPINPMLVGFGQTICLPVGPRCDICLLGQKRICPSRVGNVRSEGRKEVVYTFKSDADDQSECGAGSVRAKVEIGYEGLGGAQSLIPTVDAEAGLVKMKDEPEPELAFDGGATHAVIAQSSPAHILAHPHGVKMERDQEGVEGLIEEPGMSAVEEVMGVIDEVDGVRNEGDAATDVRSLATPSETGHGMVKTDIL